MLDEIRTGRYGRGGFGGHQEQCFKSYEEEYYESETEYNFRFNHPPKPFNGPHVNAVHHQEHHHHGVNQHGGYRGGWLEGPMRRPFGPPGGELFHKNNIKRFEYEAAGGYSKMFNSGGSGLNCHPGGGYQKSASWLRKSVD